MSSTGIDAKKLWRASRNGTPSHQFSHVLMSRPEYFAIAEATNPFSRHHSSVDLRLALQQWEQLRVAFERTGLEVLAIDPEPGLEEMCFTSNQAFAGIDSEDRSFAVPSRMLHRSRRYEVGHATHWFSQQGYRIVDLELEGEEFLEGTGDLLWNCDYESVWAGFGHRSTRGAVDQFAKLMEEMGFEVRKLELVDPYFYHLNLCLAPLTPKAVLIYPGAFAPETLARIRRWVQTFEVTREEALQFVCNGVSVNGYYITPRLDRRMEQIFKEQEIEPIVVNLSEFEKAGGSASSLKILLP